MKIATSLTALLVLCMGSAVFASTPATPVDRVDPQDLIAEKDAAMTSGPKNTPLAGGEDIGSAAPIPGLPYSDSGSTAGAINDYDESCPYTTSTAPDVVYSYSPGSSGAIDVSLCNSAYDTKVYVYENSTATVVGCNDDECGSDGFRSELTGVPVTAGNTYYIVVDGYGTGSGDYELDVTENVPCIVDCPPNSLAEGEPDCFDGYVDNYNGGCNSTPPVFTAIPCDMSGSVTVCGTYGGFFDPGSGLNYRDTDWYSIDPSANTSGIQFCVTGEYETLSGYIDASLGCGAPVFVDALVHGACVTQCWNVPAGDYWLFVATSTFGAVAGACGGDYVITLDGYTCPPVSVEPATWGQIKAKHR